MDYFYIKVFADNKIHKKNSFEIYGYLNLKKSGLNKYRNKFNTFRFKLECQYGFEYDIVSRFVSKN